jgi:ABC-type molybdenum transport system ATPase subunit/photorepair protein PhrA
MSDKIIEYIPLDGRHTRSIALDRDLSDAKALEQYVITPNSLSALRQINDGLTAGRAQRAWKIVGPYGSGKSAFGILLAQLLAGKARFPAAARALNSASSKIAKSLVGSNRFPIAIVGSRVSFGTAFANSVNEVLNVLGKSKAAQKVRKKLDMQAGTYADRPFNAAVGEIAVDL